MRIFTRPILEINLENLLDNFKTLQKLANGAKAAAVVKDDAYGLGAVEIVKKLYNDGGCRDFFVAHALEGAKIAKYVPKAKVYVLQGIGADSLALFQKHKFIPVISSYEVFLYWMRHKIKGIKPMINIETGLNRLGFRENELKLLSESHKKEFSMVMSHFSCADEAGHLMNDRQVERFDFLRKKYLLAGLPTSLAASDGVFLGKKYMGDMVRLGGAVYGLNTAPYHSIKMKNVVRVLAPVLEVTEIKKGEYAGYGATYQAQKDEMIAIASIGYGDGLPRALSNKHNILGRVSMDNIIIKGQGLKAGGYAEIMGPDYDQDAMGKDAGTIGYEILSRIGKGMRYRKRYLGSWCEEKQGFSS